MAHPGAARATCVCLATLMNQELLTNEFLEALGERAGREFDGCLHQAFVAWYIEAEFGRHMDREFTDDTSDGGIDAVVWCPDSTPPVTIIQSKFTEKIGRTKLSPDAYDSFAEVVAVFREGREAFGSFLETVRDDLRRTYRRAHQRLSELNHWGSEKKAFRLITTHERRTSE